MDRREFLAKAGLVATWAAVTVRISACSDTESSPIGPGGGDVDGDVAQNSGHSHSVTITEAQIQAGAGVELTLRENSTGHTHTVMLSSDDVVAIGAGNPVVRVSSSDSGHNHVVSFN